VTDNFPSRQIRSLLLEHLREEPSGSYHRAANGVARLAINMGLLAATLEVPGDEYSYALSHQDSRLLRERVRQELWLLLSQGILVFGKDEDNPSWPWYRLTEYGGVVVQQQGAQPYDPDGFLTEFAQKNPEADPVIGRYIEEAV